MRIQAVLSTLMLLVLFAPVANAAPAETLEVGAVFGGQWTNANESTAQVTNWSDLPAIAEDYTATWCANCVDVEHALDDVEDEMHMQQYHFHRSIGETQDPFGSDTLDERWEARYGQRVPPTVVFNGTYKQVGSVANGDSLEADFAELSNRNLDLGEGQTSFTWTPSETGGLVVWSYDIDTTQFGEGTLSAYIWVVEASAYFEDGSNGLEDYPHIVREIIDLGSETSGSMEITLPEAFDEDDLSVHMMFEVTMPEPVSEPETPPLEGPKDEGFLPSLSMLATISMLGLAGISRKHD